MTYQHAAEIWQGFTAAQEPTEFVRLSREQGHSTVEEAVAAYVADIPAMTGEDYSTEELAEIREGLTTYLESCGYRTVWTAYLGDLLLGEADSEESAIAAAVREYESQADYGDYPLLPSREELLRRLDVSAAISCPR